MLQVSLLTTLMFIWAAITIILVGLLRHEHLDLQLLPEERSRLDGDAASGQALD